MGRKVIDRKLVTGLPGVAEYVVEHLSDIVCGGTVVFLSDTVVNGGDTFETIELNSAHAFGIELSKNVFYGEDWIQTLIMGFYGYSRETQLVIISDNDPREDAINSVLEALRNLVNWTDDCGCPDDNEAVYLTLEI